MQIKKYSVHFPENSGDETFGIIIGFIVFDRRNTIKPLEQDVSVLKYRQDNLGSVIKEYAKKDKAFAEALKKVAL